MPFKAQCEQFRDAFLTGNGLADGKTLTDIQRLFKNEGNPTHPMQANDANIIDTFFDKCAEISADSNFFSPPLITDDEKDGFKEALKKGVEGYADSKVNSSPLCLPDTINDLDLGSSLLEAVQHAVNSDVEKCKW